MQYYLRIQSPSIRFKARESFASVLAEKQCEEADKHAETLLKLSRVFERTESAVYVVGDAWPPLHVESEPSSDELSGYSRSKYTKDYHQENNLQ